MCVITEFCWTAECEKFRGSLATPYQPSWDDKRMSCGQSPPSTDMTIFSPPSRLCWYHEVVWYSGAGSSHFHGLFIRLLRIMFYAAKDDMAVRVVVMEVLGDNRGGGWGGGSHALIKGTVCCVSAIE